MKMLRRYLPILVLLFGVFRAAAQDGGQLWVRAFEDRDADGVRDSSEPLLTEGVTVDLIRDGVVIASALLENEPFAAQGLVGFQTLTPGEYTVRIAAGDLTPTTPDNVTVEVGGSGLPPVVEFGGQFLSAQSSTPADPSGVLTAQDPEVMRLVISALGAVIVAGIVAVIGFLIYALLLRPRYQAALKAAKRATTTGSMRPVVIAQELEDNADQTDDSTRS